MNRKLVIRADADSRMGTGHVMRCLALAQAWKDRGGSVTFLSICKNEFLRNKIIDEGFTIIPFETHHTDASDLKATLDQLHGNGEWLVLDGYHFSPEYQKAIKDAGFHLLVIDDLNHLPYYHADIILNQNINAKNHTYHCDAATRIFAGTRYALLRREFIRYSSFEHLVKDKAHNILVTMGGSDPDNVTFKVMESLNHVEMKDVSVELILGPVNSHIEELKESANKMTCRAMVRVSPKNVPELMEWADIAITAAGTTCWELAFMGVPALTVTTAENQLEVARELDRIGLFRSLGWHGEGFMSLLAKELAELIDNPVMRKQKSQHGRQLVDGQGAAKLINAIISYDDIGSRKR